MTTVSTKTDLLPRFTVDVPSAAELAQPVVATCPLAEGELTDTSVLTMHGPAGDVTLAARPLVRWPDASTRWALLAFTATQPGEYVLRTNGAAPPPCEQPVRLEQRDDAVEIDNGRIAVTLARRGEGPVTRITLDGRAIVERGDDLQFLIDDATSLRGRIEAVELLEQSPVRAKVRVHGDHRDANDARRFSYWLDVELWAGATSLRFNYQFFNLEAGSDSQRVGSMRMRLRPATGKAAKRRLLQMRYGLFARPRAVEVDRDVCIRGDWSRDFAYIADRAMVEDESEHGPAYLKPPALQTGDWLGLHGPGGGVYAHVADFVKLRPKQLRTERDRGDDTIVVDLWPAEAGPLDVPQGRSRRHTLTLAFMPPGDEPFDPPAIERRLQAPLHEGRATLVPGRARALGVFDQDRMLEPGKHPRFDRYMRALAHGVKLGTGMFDHGDGVESGYTRNYIAIARQPLRPGVEPGVDPLRPDSPDALRPADPARYEPVWANNEYDVIHALCNELMRTGERSLWPTITAMARHNIEVDLVHYSDDPWQHHGSPAHSAYHNFASAYPSHIWTQGLLEYYCLSGDGDALDAAIKLGDTIIRNLEHPERGKFLWGFNREIGWALLALVQLQELTDEPRFAEHAGAVADYLAQYDRLGQKDPVKLSGVDPLDDIHHQIVGSFFGYASMVEAIDRYARLTRRDDLQDWLRQFLDDLRRAAINRLREGRPAGGPMFTDALAIGYELTGDRRFIDLGMLCLEMFIDGGGLRGTSGEIKSTAMTHRGLVRFLHHADQTGLLARFDYVCGDVLREH